MSLLVEQCNRRMLRARDAMDRSFAEPLCIPHLAQVAEVSEAHFIRTFCDTFGETPHRYLQRRRVERAMFLLRSTDRSVTDVCFDVGFGSVGPSAVPSARSSASRPRASGRRAACRRCRPAS